ncbi:hypothetical protein QBC34DRAFT_384947 [Podospora aff. communis PSN243]|uniref:Uncharacterized protein n=1 Tax=Podospora aff. communis PSN243 TaxID=3040156 RepID=A0AAV9G818_9PEZI|nr:hypothetical protein QBC34DRAFT_384947 [Podospora aff. communis PSN243]
MRQAFGYAYDWRRHHLRYFDDCLSAHTSAIEDIDIILRTTLWNAVGSIQDPEHRHRFTLGTINDCVSALHNLPAWPDVRPAIDALKRCRLRRMCLMRTEQKRAGMRTVYLCRRTDEMGEDINHLRRENDVVLMDGLEGLVDVIDGFT